jgi:uncharacterized protein
MSNPLNDIEVRILGSLIEKKLSTPDYYPLTLNSLTLACNQKTSRNPVTDFAEDNVLSTVKGLMGKRLVWESTLGRVPKYEENFIKSMGLDYPEAALICVIMLRGPQTPGELRINSEKMHAFHTHEEMDAAMDTLYEKELVTRLPRQPGQKEQRVAHLLGGDTELQTSIQPSAGHSMTCAHDELVLEIAAMRRELEDLKTSFMKFKSQFE